LHQLRSGSRRSERDRAKAAAVLVAIENIRAKQRGFVDLVMFISFWGEDVAPWRSHCLPQLGPRKKHKNGIRNFRAGFGTQMIGTSGLSQVAAQIPGGHVVFLENFFDEVRRRLSNPPK